MKALTLPQRFPDQDVRHGPGPGFNGAAFSRDGAHRYALWRIWSPTEPYLNVVGLNPSTADEVKLDPTCTRCERRARAMGFGGYVMTNLFSLRSTDPKGLLAVVSPEGGAVNDATIDEMARGAGMVLAAWGSDGNLWQRGPSVAERLVGMGVTLHCLGTTRGGHPRHPLYIANAVQPIVYRRAA